MSNPTWAGAFHSTGMDFSASRPAAADPATRASWSPWGMLCGVGFLAARAAVYLVAIPIAALAGMVGVVLYGMRALIGEPHA
jgi:hypothetical protein